MVQATWDDVPHLTAEQKEELWRSIPPFQRDARMRGIPQLGSGAIYPVPEGDVVCEPFRLPPYWPRAYALDVGWRRTAAVWGAWDDASDVLYLYSEYYRSQAEPAIHADAIRARGSWINGVIDPSAQGRSQIDGTRIIEQYTKLGLNLEPANNAVEAGLQAVWGRLSSARLKIFDSLHNLLSEFRVYRRDDKGRIVKQDDHLMDAMRYLIMNGLDVATTEPRHERDHDNYFSDLSRSSTTGY